MARLLEVCLVFMLIFAFFSGTGILNSLIKDISLFFKVRKNNKDLLINNLKDKLSKALESNSKRQLENFLIVHEKDLDKDVVKNLKVRVAELDFEEINEKENAKWLMRK